MTTTPTEIAGLLAEMAAEPSERRSAVLRAAGPAESLLPRLAEHIEQLAVSDVTAALRASELVLALATDAGGLLERARVERARAQALSYAGEFEAALPLLDQAEQHARAAASPVEAARARMATVHALHALGRFDDAIAAGEAAHAAFLAAGEPVLAARADANLGAIHRSRDDPAAALRHADRARPHFLRDPGMLAQLDINRGVALMDLDRFADAERAFLSALPTFEQAEMAWAAAIAEGNLAELAARQGRLQTSLYYYERARRNLEKDTADAEVARLLGEQADALETLGLLDEALDTYQRAQQQLSQHGCAPEAVRACAGAGRVLLRLGKLDHAEAALTEAADGYDALGQPAARARLDLARAELRAARGDTMGARELIRGALEQFENRPLDRAAAVLHRARLVLRAGAAEPAERVAVAAALDEAIASATARDVAPLLAELLRVRGRFARLRGDSAAAATDLREAVEQVERVRGALQAERFRAAYLGDRLGAFDELVSLLLDRSDGAAVAEAFGVVERAKSRSLLDVVQGALDSPDALGSAGDGDDAVLLEEFERLRSALNALYSRMADRLDDDPAAEAQRSADIRRHEAALVAMESRLVNARGVAALYARPHDLPTVQAGLAADARLVEYFAAGDELVAFVVDHSGASVHRGLCTSATLHEHVQQAHFQIRRAMRPGALDGVRGARLVTDARRALAALHERVFTPLRDAVAGARRLIFVPHGALHAAPLHALWDGERSLLEQFECVYAPSASLLARPASAAGAARGFGARGAARALVVGVSDEHAPQIEAEARRVADVLGSKQPLIGAAATVDAVSAAARDADVIHLAAHGHFSAQNPMASGVRLGDRWLTMRDIYRLRLRSRLVVLSGCETGRSVIGRGDELLGLVRGFFAAGTSGLVVSLWMVNDESAAEMMAEFHAAARYDRDGGAAAALRAAQLSMLARRPHPYHWAPFLLLGDV